ncbi:NAD(P)/FAD-dependent oxidoreductase [Arthrobacter sp. NPDC056727]|uniref:NAD(P)/FAD-dependent oxidoreductase n=1 Tax=Arthrobacter sp. NPDC056727 TaxID=3345927 RepID=UPI00366D2B55
MSPNPARSGGEKRQVAVVGSGVAGLTAAHILSRRDHVTLFEADSRPGGHAHTHHVRQDSGILAVDTGFIVHNNRTYPNLIRLFGELGVQTQDSDMTMSIRCDGCGLEYAGAMGARGVFARPANLARPRFLLMLAEILRFWRKARALLASPADGKGQEETLGEFLDRERFSSYFTAHFMAPVVSAVWSCDPTTALAYPARYLFTFLEHHGMLGVKGSPQWKTVKGGSRRYVDRVVQGLQEVRLSSPVLAVRRSPTGVEITTAAGTEHFDAAVIAAHPREALAMMAEPAPAEVTVLGNIPYSVNHIKFHRDPAVLPRRRAARASWNYRLPSCAARPGNVLVSYDLTRLQRLNPDDGGSYIVSLGESELIEPETVLADLVYEHPQYTPESVAAQGRLRELGDHRLAFAGAYHGWGFHEDGAASGVRAAAQLGREWEDPFAAAPDADAPDAAASDAAVSEAGQDAELVP